SVANSIQSTGRTLGNVIGMALITIMTNLIVGHTAIDAVPPEIFLKDIRCIFIVLICICVSGIFIALQRKGKRG
ncbi:MAG: hypothetical protein LBR00_06900, partial [Clostridiales Family XIII bacterium]|nr:hypothetical protein [Clostridiales Family XIII bacterium]